MNHQIHTVKIDGSDPVFFENLRCELALQRRETKDVLAVARDDLLDRSVAESTNAVVKDQVLALEWVLSLEFNVCRGSLRFDSGAPRFYSTPHAR